jgi:hypothetical protein
MPLPPRRKEAKAMGCDLSWAACVKGAMSGRWTGPTRFLPTDAIGLGWRVKHSDAHRKVIVAVARLCLHIELAVADGNTAEGGGSIHLERNGFRRPPCDRRNHGFQG